ncbi:MAG: hypothetical protein LBG26_05375 [Treponema sp.]|jgi:hypothetical protein|nr:hypothetical protein [Treponema sp.]
MEKEMVPNETLGADPSEELLLMPLAGFDPVETPVPFYVFGDDDEGDERDDMDEDDNFDDMDDDFNDDFDDDYDNDDEDDFDEEEEDYDYEEDVDYDDFDE